MLEKSFVNNALSFTNKACAALSRSNVLFLKVSNYLGMNQWFMHAWLIDNFNGVAVWLAQIAHSYISASSWRVKNISGHIWQLNFRPKSTNRKENKNKKRRLEKIINLWLNYQTTPVCPVFLLFFLAVPLLSDTHEP